MEGMKGMEAWIISEVVRLVSTGKEIRPKLAAAALMNGAFGLPIRVSKPVFSIMMMKTC